MRLAASSALLLLCLFSFVCALSIGAVQVDFYDVWLALWSYDNTQLAQKIVIELRLPRTVLAFLAGAGLATAGLILQTVTRNPLADPYLFGISSGASFGVVLLLTLFGMQSALAMSGAALLGSMCAMCLLLLIAYHKGTAQIENMLLAGVALSFLFNAFTSLLLYWSDPQAVTAIIFWSLGSFSRADWLWMWLPAVVVLSGMMTVVCFRRHLNALLLGDESAVTLGVNVHRLRLGMLLVSSLITAVLVAACGGVGFVGLMIPHIVRFFISQARVLGMLVTALSGGLLMLWVDVLARIIIENQELPIGVITAAIGSVFFLSLLMFRKRAASI
ncbi:iron ABC transporter permease [Pseudoalteromonas luteoviolacea]|uniref:FecCD family ABC transporter permease n=1 Tax=Pseudoalteromonas luteoviolacea TaxID=43657 RepID=UPI001F201E3A|nr:iron ABC transporter permease [Pseudoalteromonas luteoviolacea]MCF6438334.1 iron ABC transporter permease [Pseudoalteromonas luteoviolacea]